MAQTRSRQISLEATPYYHYNSRCVRYSFLCGLDRITNKSYEQRTDLIEKRLYLLAIIVYNFYQVNSLFLLLSCFFKH